MRIGFEQRAKAMGAAMPEPQSLRHALGATRGVNKRKFIDAVKADPQTCADRSDNGGWDYEAVGKEDKPFKQALAAGVLILPTTGRSSSPWSPASRSPRPCTGVRDAAARPRARRGRHGASRGACGSGRMT